MHRTSRLFVAVLCVLLLGGCVGARPGAEGASAPGPLRTHEALGSVLWTQTAVEYEAVAAQAYVLGRGP